MSSQQPQSMGNLPGWVRRVVAFDTETTGTDERARIVEFAAVVWEDGKQVVSLSWLLNPGDINMDDPSVRRAFEVNGIEPGSLSQYPTFGQAFEEIKAALGQADVRVAHNAPFDQRMLRQEFARAVKEGTLKAEDARPAGSKQITLDTLALDLHLRPSAKGHSLAVTADRWEVKDGYQQHRAAGDSLAAMLILRQMAPLLPEDPTELLRIQKIAQVKWQRICAYAKQKDAERGIVRP